jgi:prepilin-type N-terminal cleavage/methylation domain-containing protein
MNTKSSLNMKRVTEKICNCDGGFSLVELLAVLVISTMLIIASMGIYGQMQRTFGELNSSVETQHLPNEILQCIAEDLDRIIAPLSGKVADTQISIVNKFDQFYQSSQLKITTTYYDNKNEKQIFDEIIWQSNYDFDANGLILYRSHSGLTVEDKLLGEEKTKSKNELFIPVAAGLTHFKIQVPRGDSLLDAWTSDSLPTAIKISISFASPFRNIDGSFTVPENEMYTRTVAIDRTRQIKFTFVPSDLSELVEYEFDVNDLNIYDLNDFNDLDVFDDTKDLSEPNATDDR